MHRRLQDILCCPACSGDLDVQAYKKGRNGRVEQGVLTCGCGEWYPIINRIPRMLLGVRLTPGFHNEWMPLPYMLGPQRLDIEIGG